MGGSLPYQRLFMYRVYIWTLIIVKELAEIQNIEQ